MAEKGTALSADYKVGKPLTGMELGISLRVYSVLFARGCWPRSSHIDREDESRLAKDRKDWGERNRHLQSQRKKTKANKHGNQD